jgi:glycyl-tRNA synthetase
MNFKKLLDFNQGHMPFASASIGKCFRNEIAPRSGLLRVREFLLAEIEHFLDPERKNLDRFDEVETVELPLLDRQTQLAGKTETRLFAIGQAVRTHIVDNETLGYFLVRIYLFLVILGIDQSRVRFRQHMANEMAHYAADCWDAEFLTSYGWIECVGCADRSAFDLSAHSKRTNHPLTVQQSLPEPRTIEEWQVVLQRTKLGPLFRGGTKAIENAMQGLTQRQLAQLSDQLNTSGYIAPSGEELEGVKLTRDLVDVATNLQNPNGKRVCSERDRAFIRNRKDSVLPA